MALVRLLADFAIEPDVLAGHSTGELFASVGDGGDRLALAAVNGPSAPGLLGWRRK